MNADSEPNFLRADKSPLAKLQFCIFVVALLLLLGYRLSTSVVDPDLWHEMALAREIVATGTVPWEDSFAYTETVYPVVHHEWGAGMTGYALAMQFGANGIIALKFALILTLGCLCWLGARLQGSRFFTFGMLAIVAILLADEGFSTVRAQMYSFVFTALMMVFLIVDRNGGRWWIGPWLALYVVWLNLHAGFLLGSGLFFFNWLEQFVSRRPHKHLLACGVVMSLLICLNPYGYHYYSYLASASLMPRPEIAEWGSLFTAGRPHQFVAMIVAFVLTILTALHLKRSKTPFFGWLMILVSAVYAIKHSRMLPFFAIVWLTHIPGYLQSSSVGMALESAWRNLRLQWCVIWSAASVAAILCISESKPWILRIPGIQAEQRGAVTFPVGPVEYLAENELTGNLLVPFDNGAYVAWKLAPGVKISMDSRYEVAFPPGAFEVNYELYMNGTDWQEAVNDGQTDYVLVPVWSPLKANLTESADWFLAYIDDAFSLFVRSEKNELPIVDRTTSQINGRFP